MFTPIRNTRYAWKRLWKHFFQVQSSLRFLCAEHMLLIRARPVAHIFIDRKLDSRKFRALNTQKHNFLKTKNFRIKIEKILFWTKLITFRHHNNAIPHFLQELWNLGMHRTFISIYKSRNTLFHVLTLVLMLYEGYTTKDSQLPSFSSLVHGAWKSCKNKKKVIN